MTRLQACSSKMSLRRILPLLFIAAAMVGCEDSTKQTGTQVQPAAEQTQAQNNMADFMKPKGAAKPAAKPETPAPAK